MPASLELVKIAVRSYAAGDVEIALALSDPMIRWDERASRPEGELVWGQDEVAKAMRRYLSGWNGYSFELEEIAEAAPGKVVGICRERGTDGDGTPVDRRFGALWVVEGGKIASWSTYLAPREAVRAARELAASEPPPTPLPPRSAPKPAAASKRQEAPKPDTPEPAAPESGAAKPDVPKPIAAVPGQSPSPTPPTQGPSEAQRRAARARARLRRHKAAS